MNKTVRDAVIEFKSETSNIPVSGKQDEPLVLLRIRDADGKKAGFTCGGSVGFDDIYYSNICTYEEFDTYVDSLSHHAGKELFQQYLAADKTLLEKESKADNISCYVCHVGANPMQQYCGVCGHELLSELIPPQPKPVFTQEMSDNGELPSVGMECMILFDNDSEPEWHEITWYGLFNGNPSFLCDGKQCWPERGGEFHVKPLTPPVSPEEQALNDMIEQLTNEGIVAYDPIMLRVLMEKFKNNKIRGVSFKPLTVDKS